MPPRLFATLAAILGVAALAIDLALMYDRREHTPTGFLNALGAFLGYFSIQTGILTTAAFACAAIPDAGRLSRFFTLPTTSGWIATNVIITSIAYNLLLRPLRNPQGFSLFTDVTMHDVLPVLFLIFWWLWADKRGLRWKHAAVWLLFPLAFLGLVVLRASLGGGYTYPFMNVSKLGYPAVTCYVVGLLGAYAIIGLLLIALARWKEVRCRVT